MYYVVCDVMQNVRERVEIRAAKKNCETTKRWVYTLSEPESNRNPL